MLELINQAIITIDGNKLIPWEKNLINGKYIKIEWDKKNKEKHENDDNSSPIEYLVSINNRRFCIYTLDGSIIVYDVNDLNKILSNFQIN